MSDIHYGFRAVNPDFRSRHGFVWPFPGGTAVAPGPIEYGNKDACPWGVGDGICLALDWEGCASGAIPAHTVLICSYAASDVLGSDSGKVRVREAEVLEVVDFPALLRGVGTPEFEWVLPKSLHGVNLSGADLSFAPLEGRDLSRARLDRIDLSYATLAGANLSGATFVKTNTSFTNFAGATGIPLTGVPDGWRADSGYMPWVSLNG